MNKTAEYTKDEYLDVFFYIDKSDWEDVEYAKSRRKDAEKYLDQLLQAEREECAKDILNQYYDICKKDDSGLSAYKMQKLIKYIITIRNKK